jgi:hypothetical protein
MKKTAQGLINAELEQAPSSNRPLSHIRLAEILYRSIEILKTVRTPQFKDFARRYSLNVRQGLQLIEKFNPSGTRHSVKTFADSLKVCMQPDEYQNLVEEGYLSIYDQLLQILARWRVHHWILQNQDFIEWSLSRRDYYPLLLAVYQGADIPLQSGVTREVPQLKMLWLIDLIAPFVGNPLQIKEISAVLSYPEHAMALLRFSAQIERINSVKLGVAVKVEGSEEPALAIVNQPHYLSAIDFVKSMVVKLDNAKTLEMLQFLSNNKSFFSTLIVNYNSFHPAFKGYVQANLEAENLLRGIAGFAHALKQLFQVQNFASVLSGGNLEPHFRPLLNQLLSGYLSGCLPMLVKVAKIHDGWPVRDHGVVRVLTDLELNCETLHKFLSNDKEWRQWAQTQKQFSPAIRAFTQGLLALLKSGGCADLRPGKADVFPDAFVCFMAAISPTIQDDSSPIARSVQRFNCLSNSTYSSVVDFLGQHWVSIVPAMRAYQQHQTNLLDRMLPQPELLVLGETTNMPVTAELSPRKNVRQRPLKPRQLVFQSLKVEVAVGEENHPASSFTFSM